MGIKKKTSVGLLVLNSYDFAFIRNIKYSVNEFNFFIFKQIIIVNVAGQVAGKAYFLLFENRQVKNCGVLGFSRLLSWIIVTARFSP